MSSFGKNEFCHVSKGLVANCFEWKKPLSLQNVLKECVTPVADSLKHLVDTAPGGAATPVHKVVKAVESGLSYQFHSAWGLVLQIYAVLFEVCIDEEFTYASV